MVIARRLHGECDRNKAAAGRLGGGKGRTDGDVREPTEARRAEVDGGVQDALNARADAEPQRGLGVLRTAEQQREGGAEHELGALERARVEQEVLQPLHLRRGWCETPTKRGKRLVTGTSTPDQTTVTRDVYCHVWWPG